MQSKPAGRYMVGPASAVVIWALTSGAMAQQDAKEIIAAQLRSQGFVCDHPQSATRDTGASKPNETVWIVVCENATYRATLVPNMAAHVELMSHNEDSSTPQ